MNTAFLASRSIRRASVLGAALVVALLVVALFGPAAPVQAAPVQATQVANTQQETVLRAQVRSGALLTDHGIAAVCGHCTATMATRATDSVAPLTSTTPLGYGADDLARAYHLPAGVGARGTVAVVEAGDYPTIESDLAVYRAQFGLPSCTTASGCLKVVNFHGGPAFAPDPTPTGQIEETEAGVEAAVDIQMASAACPQCHLLEVQVPLADLAGDRRHQRGHPAGGRHVRPRWSPDRCAGSQHPVRGAEIRVHRRDGRPEHPDRHLPERVGAGPPLPGRARLGRTNRSRRAQRPDRVLRSVRADPPS
ncbi:MAG TPA: hypothetical protein VFW65_07675, partial [Pseudonocardiaceae bacterium]|nr:hypothetical protein [Pseudonocardiaceae bacterium]